MTTHNMTDEELIARALSARDLAYAPYSEYRVGCALATKNGGVYRGANVENSSYGLCVCAERSAIIAAVLDGQRHIETLVVATQSSPPAAPCGACRQTISEFAMASCKIILVNADHERLDIDFRELFPYAFQEDSLSSSD